MENNKRETNGVFGNRWIALICFTAVFLSACTVRTNSVRIGYVESSTSTHWKANYTSLDGTMTGTLKVKSGILKVDITTESGSISLDITDENGNNVYKGKNLGTCSFTVKTSGKTKITVTTEKHKGSFNFTEEQKGNTSMSGNGNGAGFESISMDEAKTIFASFGDYIILDVRRADEFAEGHIPGAINIANESITDSEPDGLDDKNQTIYVYCRSGNRSKQAAGKLAAMGYKHIIECGGIIDWKGIIEK